MYVCSVDQNNEYVVTLQHQQIKHEPQIILGDPGAASRAGKGFSWAKDPFNQVLVA